MSMPTPQSPAPRLAVAMIARDAELLIDETLHSVSDIADMIVVVDTGSSDTTLNVANRHTPHVFASRWGDDFSAARNECLAHLNAQWILWLDAGDRIEPDEAKQLRAFIDTEANSETAYMMLVRTPRSETGIAAEQVGRIRLVPNRPEIRFTGRIRESLDESLESTGIGLEGLPWRIHRNVAQHDPTIQQAKARRDLHLGELESREIGPRSRLFNCMGEALLTLGEKQRAAECFRQSLQFSAKSSTEMLEAYYGLLTALDGSEQGRDAQLSACLEALETFPLDAQLLCAMGGYLQSLDRLELAARSYETAFRFGQINPSAWHLDEVREISATCWSLALQLQEKDSDAQTALEEALSSNESSLRLRRLILDLHVKHGRTEEAMDHFKKLPESVPDRDALGLALGGACLAAQQQWEDALSQLSAAYQNGCRDPLCLRWLLVTHCHHHNVAAARAIVEEWTRLDPSNAEIARFLEMLEKQAGPEQVGIDSSEEASSIQSKPHSECPGPKQAA